MREIKFRGYAVEEMVGSQRVYGTGIHVTEFTDEYFKETGKKEECFIWTDSGWVEVYKYSIGQFTGLKDKNGRDIYEGDILEVVSEIVDYKGRAIKGEVPSIKRSRIAWHKSGAWSKFDDLTDKHIGIPCVHKPEVWCEVIGNIYENPELLVGDSK